MDRLRVRAYAKLNLTLRVVGRREDGYHLLQSLSCAVDLADELELAPRARGIELLAPPELGPPEANLAFLAARALLGEGPGVRIMLWKGIPAGAGLGGGSADAAAVLAGLNELFSLGKPPHELQRIGAGLGADVPFFLGPSPAWVEGVGDKITPLDVPLPTAFLVLVPSFRCPTPDVYRAFDALGLPFSAPAPPPMEAAIGNDLWPAAIHLFPALGALRANLARASRARVGMTGSGSALFAPFPSWQEAEEGRRRVKPHVEGDLFIASPTRSGYRIVG